MINVVDGVVFELGLWRSAVQRGAGFVLRSEAKLRLTCEHVVSDMIEKILILCFGRVLLKNVFPKPVQRKAREYDDIRSS